jgi:serine/threonine-protein kinase
MDVTIGQLLDKKYRIVRLLGEGGMGAVYEGENVRIHHRVAIKLLHAGIATNQAVVERFEREAQAAGKIGSEHIVEVYDLGDLPTGARYMVMEFLDGENLTQRVTRSGKMTPQDVAPVMLQLLEGLKAAHHAGIIHRDLKPDNIFLTKAKKGGGDFVKIVDFGVSKFNQMSGDSAMSMTRTGAVIGTPYYMSPEQAKGAKNTDHRSDLYSAGVVLFECITGQVPFLADTFNELMFKIVLEPPPDPEKMVPGLDPTFAAIVRKGMAREADHRFQSADEFAQAIADWMAQRPVAIGAPPQSARGPMDSVPQLPGAGPAVAVSSPGQYGGNAPAAAQSNPQLGGTAGNMSQTVGGEKKKSNTALIAAAVGAVVLIGVIGVGLKVVGGSKTAETTPSATAANANTAPPATAAAPTPKETAAAATAAPAVDSGATVAAAATPPSEPETKTKPSSHDRDRGPSGRSGGSTTKPVEKSAAAPTPAKTPDSKVGGRAITDTL